MRRLLLLHAAANAALLALGYYWLGVGETRAATLLWSALVALVWLVLAPVAYGAPLAYFQAKHPEANGAWRQSLRHVLPLVILLLVTIVLYWLLQRWVAQSVILATHMASWLTLNLRKPVKPASVLQVFNVLRWFVAWALIPWILLPVASAVSARGWSGFRAPGFRRSWLFRLAVPVLLLAAFWAPLKLVAWVPYSGGFWMESASFAVRALVAYCLLVAGWVAVAFVASGGNPRFSHNKTVASP